MPAIGSQPSHNSQLAIRNPQPLFWADGITQIGQLPAYQRAGFNTVVVRVTWPPTPDGQITPADLLPQRSFAEAAAKLGLKVIYALPAAPFGQESAFHVSGETGPYRQLWADWAGRVMGQLRDTPNLLGWMLPDDPRALPFRTNVGFRRWIADNYGSIEVLNRQWNAGFPSLDEVSMAATKALIARWRGPGPLPTAATDVQIRNYIAQSQKRKAIDNFAFHPAELALAHYQWDAYRSLLDFWAQTIRAADGPHTIFSGNLPDYAQLLSLPPSVDVSVPALSPLWAEKDIGTHNPQAVAVARRGGRFGAVPVLSTQLPDAPEDLVPRLVPSWCDAMLAQGASGIAFDSWPAIAQDGNLRGAIRNSLRRLQSDQYSVLWNGGGPQATAAVVLTPLADSYTWRPPGTPDDALPTLGAPLPDVSPPRGLYGFGEDMVQGEPGDLVYALRWGTLFGNVDFISPDELGGAYSMTTGGVLKRYGTVFLPQALYVSPQMAQELANYIASGGTVVADVGLGAAQNGGQVIGLSESLVAIFGTIPTQLQTLALNLQTATPHPLLPTWSALAASRPEVLTSGDGPKGAAFAGPVVFGEMAPGTVPLALAFQLPQQLGGGGNPSATGRRSSTTPNTPPARVRFLRSWLTLRPFGNGNAIFAPFRMWNMWRPGYPGFDAFHGDLLSHGAQLSQLNVQSLVPAPPGTTDGTALYPEAINFPDAVVLINHNAAPNAPYGWFASRASENAMQPNGNEEGAGIVPAPSGVAAELKELTTALTANPSQPAIVQTSGIEQFVWSNSLCLFPVGAAPATTLGRHPPIADVASIAGDSGFVVPPTSHPVILHALVPAQEMRVLRLLPIRAVNPGGGPLACRVREYSPQRIELRVWPNAQSAAPGQTDWQVTLGSEGAVRLTIFDKNNDAAFRVKPNTRYRISITEISTDGKTRTTSTRAYILTSDTQGTLSFEIRGVSLRIEIEPLDAPTRPDAPTPEPSTPATLTPAIVPDTPTAITPDAPAVMPDAPPDDQPPTRPQLLSPPPDDAPTTPAPTTPAPPAPDERTPPSEDGPLFHKHYN